MSEPKTPLFFDLETEFEKQVEYQTLHFKLACFNRGGLRVQYFQFASSYHIGVNEVNLYRLHDSGNDYSVKLNVKNTFMPIIANVSQYLKQS